MRGVATAAALIAIGVAATVLRAPERGLKLTSARGALSVSPRGAVLTAGDLAPGRRVTGTLAVESSRPVVLSDTVAGARLARALRVHVTDAGSGRVLFSGTFGGLHATLPAGARRYRFTVTLPRSAGNELQGASARVRLRFSSH